jgi:hypothetical protein
MRKGKPEILVSRVMMVIVAVVLAVIGVLGPNPGSTPAALAASDVGYQDFSFSAQGVENPTGEKPQSKLWFNDGAWWGSLFDRSSEEYHIYRYDWTAHTWSDTGTLIDERNTSKADTLWDGTHLYVVSAGSGLKNTSHGARILRYSYSSATKKYTLDQGFPVTITKTGLESIVLDKDTTGKLWVTYREPSDNKIYVNRTLNDDRTWGTPFVLPVNGANVSSDDISSVVAFDSQVGVMWSNQIDSAIYFATHKDGDPDNVWQSSRTAIQGPNFADDHISLRSLQAADSSGRVFAAVKTSLNDLRNPNPNAPLIFLLVRDRDGNWTNHVFGRVGDNHTRPILMLDEEHRDLYMFATAPCCTGGAIYYKKTSINNVSFPDGLGTPFIQSATDTSINDATSTKQNVSSATGLLVMASSGTVVGTGGTGSGYYWHNAVDLGVVDNIPPETGIDSGPSGTVNDSSASFAFSSTEPDSRFECALDSASFSSCTSPQDYTSLSDGSHTFQVRATDVAGNTDATPANYTWTVETTAVDTSAPETTIDSGPPVTVKSASASFAFSSSEPGSSFECKLDGGAFESCASPKSYSNLPDGSHLFEVRATDVAGNVDATPADRTWTIDMTAPAVQPPAHDFVDNSSLGTSTIPVKLTWSATDDSGVAGYQLQQSTNGGAYKNVSLTSATTTTITRSLAPGNTYQFRVQAQDQVGNWSSWTSGPSFRIEAYQESDAAISYVNLWTTQTLTGAYGGALKYAKGLGTEKATFVFTGSEVGWVAPPNKNRGQADVYLDGAKVATVDLYSASNKSRTVVFSKAGLDPSVIHTLEVRALGTKNAASTGKRVDVDAFVVLR